MSSISGAAPKSQRLSIDPPGRRAEDESNRATQSGSGAVRTRIGKDAPEGHGPPSLRPNAYAQSLLGPRLETQTAFATPGAAPKAPRGHTATKPRVSFNTDANTVHHFEIADGNHLRPVGAPALKPPALAPVKSGTAGAGAERGEPGRRVASGGARLASKAAEAEWEFALPAKKKGIFSRIARALTGAGNRN